MDSYDRTILMIERNVLSPEKTDSHSPHFLVYRDRLLPRSEYNFIRNQYSHFTRLKPVYVGRHWDNPPDFIEPRYFIGEQGLLRFFKRRAFTHAGKDVENLIDKEHPCLIHAQFATSAAYVLPFAQKHKLPLIVTCHGADVYKKSNRHKLLGKRFKELVDYTSLFVAVCHDIAQRLIDLGVPKEKIKTVIIGVPDKGVVKTHKKPAILMAGRFIEKKGHQVLIDALSILKEHKMEPDVLLAGDGPQKKHIEKLVKRRNLQHVKFCGWLNQDALRHAFSEVSAVVIPSIKASNGDQEGWPTIAKEAAMAGLPVIASKDTAIPAQALVEAGGMDVPSDDPKSLALGIMDILYEGALYLPNRRMHARAFALTHLEDTLLSVKLENVLLDVLREHRRNSVI